MAREHRKSVSLIGISLLLGLLALWIPSPHAAPKAIVYVTSYPLNYFVDRIGKEHVKTVFPVPAGMNPIFWMPDADTLVAMQQSDLIVINGAAYEKWLAMVSLPTSKVVDTSIAFRDQYIATEDTVSHSHGQQGAHAHTGTRYATWLDFQLATLQAETVLEALIRILPAQKAVFQRNFDALKRDLLQLDRALSDIGDAAKGSHFLASHPVYDYMARRYALSVRSVHWFPTSMPGPEQWRSLAKMVEGRPARWMIWEAAPLAASEKKLQGLGIGSLVFDICSSPPVQGDFLTVMRQNIDNLRSAVQTD